MWERYFRFFPPGFLVAEQVGRFMLGFVSTKAKPVSLAEVCPWVKGRAGMPQKRRRTVKDARRLASGFAEAMRRKHAGKV